VLLIVQNDSDRQSFWLCRGRELACDLAHVGIFVLYFDYGMRQERLVGSGHRVYAGKRVQYKSEQEMHHVCGCLVCLHIFAWQVANEYSY